jgi:hypothetical protein
MGFLVTAWNVLKYISVGSLIWLMGTLFFGDSMAFQSRSVPAQLEVVDVTSKRNPEGGHSYCPVFARADTGSPRQNHAGNTCSRIRPHERGDIVPGRYDPASGEMRSDRMLANAHWFGWIARVLGIFLGLEGVLILLGVPEHRLPLALRVRSRPRRPALFRS